MRYIKVAILLLGGTLIWLMFNSCSFSVECVDEEMYSREDTAVMSDSKTFGKGRNDDIYVALQYIYSDDEIKQKYGENFQVKESDVVCIISESQSLFLISLYKGKAEYNIKIAEDTYTVKLLKDYFGVWSVTEIYLET